MKVRRSMLFMPGNNPGMLQTASVFGADSVILDLEDAVSIDEKDGARILVREALKSLKFNDVETLVRINPLTTEFARRDIEIIARENPDGIVVPKAVPSDVEEVDRLLGEIEREMGFEKGQIKLHLLVESAIGVELVYESVKVSNRCESVLFGGEDLATDLNVKRTKDSKELFYGKTKVVNVCKALKVDVIDTPFTDTDDSEGLVEDTKRGKEIGFTGKLAINPRQIDEINKVYSPTIKEIEYAKKIVYQEKKALEEGLGVFTVDGKMIDLPIINRAKNTLKLAKSMGLI